MKVKASEATPKQIDWLVAKCEYVLSQRSVPKYTTDWSEAGPIIEREHLNLSCLDDDAWEAWPNTGMNDDTYCQGPTPLIAAMRCFVASKLGEEVDVPEELQ